MLHHQRLNPKRRHFVLWQRGKLFELANRALSAKLEHPPGTRSKKAKFARVARLADSKGIADATRDTLDAIPDLFKEPEHVDKETLQKLYGFRVTPTRESMSVTLTPGEAYS